MRSILKALLAVIAVMALVLSLVLMAMIIVSAFVFGGSMRAEKRQTYAYFYFMHGLPDEVMALVPSHVDYWQGLRLDGYRGGPFVDHSGGMIVFGASSANRAGELVAGDPFVQGGVVGESWLKAWRVE